MNQVEGVRLPIDKWLDYHGIDRAYKKDMKATYKTISEDLDAQTCFLRDVKGWVSKKERDTWWHNNIQRVKKLIQEGKNPQSERDMNVAYDDWHPELALLWEIAIEALKKEAQNEPS